MIKTKKYITFMIVTLIFVAIGLNAGQKGLTYFGQSENSNISKQNRVFICDYNIYYTNNSVIKFDDAFAEYSYYKPVGSNSTIDIYSSMILIILPVTYGEDILKYNNYDGINHNYSLSYLTNKHGDKMYFSLGFYKEIPPDTISFWVRPTSRKNNSLNIKNDTITLIRKKR